MAIAAAGLAVIGVSSATPALASARPVRYAASTPAASTPAVNMNRHVHINCADASASCTEVLESDRVFGHDVPSALFYSHKPGSGNHMSYNVTLPARATPPGGAPR